MDLLMIKGSFTNIAIKLKCMEFVTETVELERSLSPQKMNVELNQMIIGKQRKRHLGGKDNGR